MLKGVGESESKIESVRHHDEEFKWQVMDIRSRDIWELELIPGVVRGGSSGEKCRKEQQQKSTL